MFSVLSEGESHIWVCKWWHPPSYFRRQSCFASVSSCCNMSPPPLSPPLPLRRQWPSCENPPPPLRAVQHPPLPLTSCSAPKPIQLINCQSLCTDSKYRGASVLYVESPGEQCAEIFINNLINRRHTTGTACQKAKFAWRGVRPVSVKMFDRRRQN